jgi:transcriptional regulator with XRE-family HTH domain
MSDSNNLFGPRLRALMEEMEISQTTLAKTSGVPQSAISLYLSGNRIPGIDTVTVIAEALNVSPFYLLMSQEERDIWDNISRPNEIAHPHSSSVREKLARAVLALPDVEAENFLSIVEKRLQSLSTPKKKAN